MEEPKTGMALDEDSDLYLTVYTMSKAFKPAKVRNIHNFSILLNF